MQAPTPAQVYDYLVIGSGIVGLTVALELNRRHPAARICVCEKEAAPGMHASGRNSGVLHSGIYYGRDTLKAKNCSTGARKMMAFAEEHGIPYHKSGKVIIAPEERDLSTVEHLLANAAASGIRAYAIDAKQLREIEPHANFGFAAIHSPDTAVIDSRAVVQKLHQLLIDRGVSFCFGRTVKKSRHAGEVTIGGATLAYGHLFNCCGAYADVLARQYGLAKDYIMLPFKGIYWKLRPEAADKVRANIYPVPDIDLPFLGVHATRVISDEVYVGPTAIPALGRENYGYFSGARPLEALGIGARLAGLYVANPGNFRQLAHHELAKYRKHNFLKAVRRLVPSIAMDDLLPSPKSGIRPQLFDLRTQRLEMDHVLLQGGNSTHVLNAISPAFTGAFSFAETIVDSSQTV
jgi:L-2-hydroxyglutarate oxidase LhgO